MKVDSFIILWMLINNIIEIISFFNRMCVLKGIYRDTFAFESKAIQE